MGDSKVVCQCGNDRFQAVGIVQTVQPVALTRGGGKVEFVDYAGEWNTVDDSEETYFLECTSCLKRVYPEEGFESTIPPWETVHRIHRILDGDPDEPPVEWNGGDVCEEIAGVMREAGYEIREVE